MEIRIGSRKVAISGNLQRFVKTLLLERLRRYSAAIAGVYVELSDRNGRRGGGDKRCRIRVTMIEGGRIVRDDMRANLRTAVCCATDRLEKAVHRQMRVPAV
jgi:putative sigma-54 modulation protein